MMQNENLLAKVGLDTAENGPLSLGVLNIPNSEFDDIYRFCTLPDFY